MLSTVPVSAWSQRQSTTALTRYTPQQRRMASPSFGSRLALATMTDTVVKNGLEPLFRSTQEYIWELMMLDVVSIWIPRIVNAMNRGRFKVSLNEITNDPEHKNKSSLRQFGVWAKKNIAGYNWPNGVEETWREVQSAPMVLFVQSVLFGLLMHYDPIKTGLMMPKADLEAMNRSYAKWLVAHPQRAQNMLGMKRGLKESMQGFYTDLLKSHFDNVPMDLQYMKENATPIGVNRSKLADPKRTKAVSTQRQEALNWLEKHFGKQALEKPPTYHQAISRWTQDMARAISEGKPHKEVAHLETILHRLTQEFNEQVMHQRPKPILPTHLHLFGPNTRGKTANEAVELFQKYYDYTRGLRTSLRKEGLKEFNAPALLNAATRKLFEMERRMLPRKMLYSLGVIGLTMVVYFASSIHAQSNNRYPANRLYAIPRQPKLPTAAQGNHLSRALNRGVVNYQADNTQQGGVL